MTQTWQDHARDVRYLRSGEPIFWQHQSLEIRLEHFMEGLWQAPVIFEPTPVPLALKTVVLHTGVSACTKIFVFDLEKVRKFASSVIHPEFPTKWTEPSGQQPPGLHKVLDVNRCVLEILHIEMTQADTATVYAGFLGTIMHSAELPSYA